MVASRQASQVDTHAVSACLSPLCDRNVLVLQTTNLLPYWLSAFGDGLYMELETSPTVQHFGPGSAERSLLLEVSRRGSALNSILFLLTSLSECSSIIFCSL